MSAIQFFCLLFVWAPIKQWVGGKVATHTQAHKVDYIYVFLYKKQQSLIICTIYIVYVTNNLYI